MNTPKRNSTAHVTLERQDLISRAQANHPTNTGRQPLTFSPYPEWGEHDMPRSFEASDNRFLPARNTPLASIFSPSADGKLVVQSHGYPPDKYHKITSREPADLCVFCCHSDGVVLIITMRRRQHDC